MRQHAVIQPDDEHLGKFQALGGMQGQQGGGVQFSGRVSWSETSARFSRKSVPARVPRIRRPGGAAPARCPSGPGLLRCCRRCNPGSRYPPECGQTGSCSGRPVAGTPGRAQLAPKSDQAARSRARKTAPRYGDSSSLVPRSSSTSPGGISVLRRQLAAGQGLIADAARRHVDHPRQADLVGWVVHQAQVGDQVLDLAPAVEALGAHQAVGHPARRKASSSRRDWALVRYITAKSPPLLCRAGSAVWMVSTT